MWLVRRACLRSAFKKVLGALITNEVNASLSNSKLMTDNMKYADGRLIKTNFQHNKKTITSCETIKALLTQLLYPIIRDNSQNNN